MVVMGLHQLFDLYFTEAGVTSLSFQPLPGSHVGGGGLPGSEILIPDR